MIEVEVKSRELGEDQLMKIGRFTSNWKFIGEKTQEDIYYSHPSVDFNQTDECLRIRRVGEDFRLTYKGPKLDDVTKTREEIELETSPGMERVLERLGFRRMAKIVKKRSNFVRENIVLSIDEVKDLGTFIELESNSNRPEDAEKLLKILESLDLESERRSYLELFLEADH